MPVHVRQRQRACPQRGRPHRGAASRPSNCQDPHRHPPPSSLPPAGPGAEDPHKIMRRHGPGPGLRERGQHRHRAGSSRRMGPAGAGSGSPGWWSAAPRGPALVGWSSCGADLPPRGDYRPARASAAASPARTLTAKVCHIRIARDRPIASASVTRASGSDGRLPEAARRRGQLRAPARAQLWSHSALVSGGIRRILTGEISARFRAGVSLLPVAVRAWLRCPGRFERMAFGGGPADG